MFLEFASDNTLCHLIIRVYIDDYLFLFLPTAIAGNVINVTLVITNEKCNGGNHNQSLLWTKLNETVTTS